MYAYESPKLTFQQITLFEKIASSCWSANSAFFDMNFNGRSDGGEGLIIKNRRCADNNSNILQQMSAKLGLFYWSWYMYSGAANSNILANTGAIGIRCDFTSGGAPHPTATPTPRPTPTPCPPPGWPWPGYPWWN